MKLKHGNQVRSKREGSALALTVILTAGLLLIGYAFASAVQSNTRELSSSFDDSRAVFLAEAGLNEGYRAVQTGRTGAFGSQDDPAYLGGGVVWVTSEDLGDNRRRLISTALVGSGRASLESVVRFSGGDSPLFEATLNSKETLTLNQGVLIDSFDSSLGDYAAQATNVHNGNSYARNNGDVRSNSDILLNARATVLGDAVPGPAGTVQFNLDSYVDGDTTSSQNLFDFPEIDIPTYPSAGNYTVPTNGSAVLPSGNYAFDSFSVNKDATLTVRGPAEIVVTDFIGNRNGNLVIDATAGPVTFYVENSYSHGNGFEATPAAGSPMAVAFLVAGTQDIVFPNSTNVRGAYYTPNANIVFSNYCECWGAFAGNRIDMSNEMNFHFDEVLSDHWDADTDQGDIGDFEIQGWRDLPVRPQSLLQDRRDPILMLGLDRSLLSSPAVLWEQEALP